MQRVSIGRAIVRKPRVFLMDEPLSNLDAKLREALRAELKDLQMKLGATFLFVTHDQIEAMSMGDKIGVLNDGRIVQIGTPQRDLQRAARHLRRELRRLAGDEPLPRRDAMDGRRSLCPASSRCASRLPENAVAPSLGPAAAVTARHPLRGHPRRCETSRSGRVHDVENHGVEKIVTLRSGPHLLRAAVPATLALALDQPTRFGMNLGRLHAFDAGNGRRLGG